MTAHVGQAVTPALFVQSAHLIHSLGARNSFRGVPNSGNKFLTNGVISTWHGSARIPGGQ